MGIISVLNYLPLKNSSDFFNSTLSKPDERLKIKAQHLINYSHKRNRNTNLKGDQLLKLKQMGSFLWKKHLGHEMM